MTVRHGSRNDNHYHRHLAMITTPCDSIPVMTSAPGHAHSGPHGNEHGPGAGSDRRHLLIALALLAAFMAAEVIVAVLSGSLALLSDAGHMLSDVGAIGGALWAIALAAAPRPGSGPTGSSGPRSCPPPATGSPCSWSAGSSPLRR